MTYVNAGHNPPLLVRRGGGVERLEGGGIILGILKRAPYTLQVASMRPGDLLVLFSDGVTEPQMPGTDDDFGEDRMLEAIGPIAACAPAVMIEQVKRAVTAFAGSVTAQDDFTLVLARRTQ
ncbi:MAG: PP2C family protein-serine/threonine phosphatase [Acidobacteria bacterium]|nr:PP2C family protein-serine/threonine phosphatase [Acidobacteriota bacterium]